MKKFLVVVALVALTFTAFGQVKLSAGAGASFAPQWMTLKQTYDIAPFDGDTSSGTISQSILSIAAFVDATYVQASVGFVMDVGDATLTTKYSNAGLGTGATTTTDLDQTWLSLGVLGKYPFKAGSFTVFPLLGFEYDLNLSNKVNGTDTKDSLSDDQKANLNQFWLKAGVGADFAVNSKVFVRPSAIFGYKLHSKLQSDNLESLEAMPGVGKATQTDIRIDIGAAVGFKL